MNPFTRMMDDGVRALLRRAAMQATSDDGFFSVSEFHARALFSIACLYLGIIVVLASGAGGLVYLSLNEPKPDDPQNPVVQGQGPGPAVTPSLRDALENLGVVKARDDEQERQSFWKEFQEETGLSADLLKKIFPRLVEERNSSELKGIKEQLLNEQVSLNSGVEASLLRMHPRLVTVNRAISDSSRFLSTIKEKLAPLSDQIARDIAGGGLLADPRYREQWRVVQAVDLGARNVTDPLPDLERRQVDGVPMQRKDLLALLKFADELERTCVAVRSAEGQIALFVKFLPDDVMRRMLFKGQPDDVATLRAILGGMKLVWDKRNDEKTLIKMSMAEKNNYRTGIDKELFGEHWGNGEIAYYWYEFNGYTSNLKCNTDDARTIILLEGDLIPCICRVNGLNAGTLAGELGGVVESLIGLLTGRPFPGASGEPGRKLDDTNGIGMEVPEWMRRPPRPGSIPRPPEADSGLPLPQPNSPEDLRDEQILMDAARSKGGTKDQAGAEAKSGGGEPESEPAVGHDAPPLAGRLPVRTWTNTRGLRWTGRVVGREGKTIYFDGPAGRMMELLEQLSRDGQEYIKEHEDEIPQGRPAANSEDRKNRPLRKSNSKKSNAQGEALDFLFRRGS